MTTFIPLEQRVLVCSLPSRMCDGQVHLYRVHPTKDPEPHDELLCAWHGQLWPRTDSDRPAEEAKRARRRRALQEGSGFGHLAKLGRGKRANNLET